MKLWPDMPAFLEHKQFYSSAFHAKIHRCFPKREKHLWISHILQLDMISSTIPF